jgi:hypothetical protein
MPGRPGKIPSWILYAGLTLLGFFSISAAVRRSAPFFAPNWDRVSFYDFRLWRDGIETLAHTGRLYDTDTPGYFLPGSHSLS